MRAAKSDCARRWQEGENETAPPGLAARQSRGLSYFVEPRPESPSVTVPALVATAVDAERLPDAAGVNVCCSEQLWPAASAVLTAQVPARSNSPGFAPPEFSDVIVSVPPPVLVSVTDFVELVEPTFTLPNFTDVALSVATAAVGGVEAAASVTVNVAPPMLRLALRCDPVLAAADQPMVALPVPVVAVVTVSQVALLPVFHAQPALVVSVVDPVPPPSPTLALVGLSV